MENKINIAELLKDCPKGMELYSPIFGKVYLDKIRPHLAIVVTTDKYKEEFLYDGRYGMNGECMLFPSKDQRDWSKFQRHFKDGDILISGLEDNPFIFKRINGLGNAQCYCAISCFGQLILNDDNWTYIKGCRLATEEEKSKLFQAIKDNGYKWNAETKTLEKLGKEKFDITTLKPFESRVLVRGDICNFWKPAIFGLIKDKFFYILGGAAYRQCIPYKNNEHLLGTTNDCDKFYKNW